MDTEMIKEMAESVNNVVLATAKPYQEQIQQLQQKIMRIEQLKAYYKSIGFNDTAERIEQALKG